MAPLLDQIPGEIEQVTADGEPTYETIATRSADIAFVIPPRASSTAPPDLGMDASRRDALALLTSIFPIATKPIIRLSARDFAVGTAKR